MKSPVSLTSLAPVSRNGHSVAPVAPNTSLVMLADPRSPAAEAYRGLAANIKFNNTDGQLNVLGITSAAAGEGKTTTVANLAVALAESGRQVIVIDADLRRPGLHTLFGVNREDGLSSLLVGDVTTLPVQDTLAPGVRVLASGPPLANAMEALGSLRLEHVLALARAQADFVLVDTAPAAALADAALVAPRLGGMLLVVCAGKTKRDIARRARERLERVNARLIGVVLTDVRGDEQLYQY